MPGTVAFGRYLLVDKLALGGMAEIFLARIHGEAGFEKTCVIKRLLPHLTAVPGLVEMFLDEARIAARLNHPGIVQIFDLGCERGDYYFAMEYLPGEDASTLLKQAIETKVPLPVDVVARIGALAAEALHYAHEVKGADGRPMGIVHRDVSPSNVFITYHGAVKILDFGIARAEQRLQRTLAGHVKGKIAYMPPEQARGTPVDRRADVWSLAVTLYELLTAQRLFWRESMEDTVAALASGTIAPIRAKNPDVPQELEDAIMDALERDRERRLPDAESLRKRLDAFLSRQAYAAPSVLLANFMHGAFGDERAQERFRKDIGEEKRRPGEGTEMLSAARVPVVEQGMLTELVEREDARPPPSPPAPSPQVPNAAPTVVVDPSELLPPAPPARRPAHRTAAIAAVAVGIFALAGIALWPTPRPPPSPAPEKVAIEEPEVVAAPPVIIAVEDDPAKDEGVQIAAPAVPDAGGMDEPVAAFASAQEDAGVKLAAVTRPPRKAEPHRSRSSNTTKARSTEPGRLTIASNAPAAAWLDGIRIGFLPLTDVPVAPGWHRLTVKNETLGISSTRKLRVRPGQKIVHSARFGKGKLVIDTTPGAVVFLNGANVGRAPVAPLEVWEGRHSVRVVTASGAKSADVRVRANRTRKVDLPL